MTTATKLPDGASPHAVPSAPGRAPMTRRSALRAVGTGALTVAVGGAGLLSYRAYDNRVLGSDGSRAYDAWRDWRLDSGPAGAIAAAVLAASPHNTQPWTFQLTGSVIDVHADPTRRIGAVDPYLRELHVGLGCAVENLVLAGAARAFDPRVTLMPDAGDPDLVARVTLAAGARRSSPLHDAIGDRHTNRGPYTPAPVPEAELAKLSALAGDGGPRLAWVTSPAEKDALGRLLVEGAQAVTADVDQSLDGYTWFRSTADEIAAHQDGLTLDAQGLSPVVLAAAKLLPATTREAGDAFWVDQTRTVHTRTAAAYGFVLVDDPLDPVDQLLGGRLLQRVHLAATASGLAFQHMNQVTERIDRDRSLGRGQAFEPRLGALAARAARPSLTRGGSPGQVLVTFRLGYPVRAALRSPRRPVQEVLR